jgi:GGDEF domain-containing protein
MLAGVAALIRDRVGDSGVVARLGGDEFGVLLMECPIETAREIAESIVSEIADYRFTWNCGGHANVNGDYTDGEQGLQRIVNSASARS